VPVPAIFQFSCADGKYRKSVNGVVLRSDGIRYQDEGARIVARWILPQVPGAATDAKTKTG
jgi:hypothetical protein